MWGYPVLRVECNQCVWALFQGEVRGRATKRVAFADLETYQWFLLTLSLSYLCYLACMFIHDHVRRGPFIPYYSP